MPADFDGDGKDDPALYCEADGQWVAILSGSGYAQASLVMGGPGYSAVTWPDNPSHVGWRTWCFTHGWRGHDDSEWYAHDFYPMRRY